VILRDIRNLGSFAYPPTCMWVVDDKGLAWPDTVPSYEEYLRLLRDHEREKSR
jgi:hypothetical protein